MDTIQTRAELMQNLATLERYMGSADTEEREFHKGLVKNGICFVAYEKNGRHLFAPSRFVGYAHNTMTQHRDNEFKDGKETNPAIDKILGRCSVSNTMNGLYVKYCSELGFVARERGTYGKERKFWRI